MTRIEPSDRPTARHVLGVFTRLGLTSFGGPVAHLGYFRDEFVKRKNWLSDRDYADLVALCQFLPGPSSSQVGMAIGLHRAGGLGMLAAWIGFTLPSAILLVLFAVGLTAVGDTAGAGWLLGLKAAAVAVVAHAVWGMAKSLTPDAKRATIALVTLLIVILFPGVLSQVIAILVAGIVGWLWLGDSEKRDDIVSDIKVGIPRAVAVICLGLFFLLLVGLPLLASLTSQPIIGQIDTYYRAGALVFGGGHVVLPLLEAETVQTGLVTHDQFLAGYGAAQAVPGPLFTFAAYLGYVSVGGGVAGAVVALLAIFLPSVLLIVGIIPFWEGLRHRSRVRRVLSGVNAGVVGILAAALYTPVFTSGITGPETFGVMAVALVALAVWKQPAWLVVLGSALLGLVFL
ncbi:chromate efflux transporter [Flaviflexus massiliensis]|uniref:chromate efflux transporter n=1 Tax=Flaviflexus massiliensis TaxID=1522309 RepID=UPI000B12C14B|nr:chromate efflux transporter [Flaviflexus massiliensis]